MSASKKCSICTHPEAAAINAALSMHGRAASEVARKWDLGARMLRYHRQHHLSQEDQARIRMGIPDDIEIDLDALVRRGGQEAILGLARLIGELQVQAAKADKAGEFQAANQSRGLQIKAHIEQARLASLYPGLRNTVNNNLIVDDGSVIFRLVHEWLTPFPEARRAVAQGFARLSAEPAIIEGPSCD